jgi:hypothetical protein
MTASSPFVLSAATRLNPRSLRAHSASPSRSPIRRAEFTAHELDPLLGNLSPESTLQALSAPEAPSTSGQRRQDGLHASIANASAAERALGVKAALAAQNVRQWLTEVGSWHWPDPKASSLGAGFLQPTVDRTGGQDAVSRPDDRYMGSLRAETVKQYEARIEEIKDGLEALDVEDLKEHVLDAHVPSRSRPGTRNGLSEVATTGTEYGRLGDLTAVITATILQTLPYLAELNMLLCIWDVRIAVLFEVPELVQSLNTTRAAIEEALKDVRSEKSTSLYTKSYVEATKERLETDVSSLGVRFDKALDRLEGREDSLPNSWIEEMDTIESKFGDWVVEADRRATSNHWRQQRGQLAAARESSKPARQLETGPSGGVAGPKIRSTDSPPMADHSTTNDIDGPQSSTKQHLLPEPPALAAFREQPVRKQSVDHPPVDSDGHSAHVFPGRPHAVDQEETVAASTTIGEQMITAIPPKDARHPDGHSPQHPTSDVPAVSYSPQQQARLAELISLNNAKSAKEYQGRFVRLGHDNALPSTGDKGVQPEPFPFLAQEPETAYDLSKKKPSLKLDLRPTRHRREVSEVSIADSAISEAFSDMSNAEIVDARRTQVLATPKINVVDSPFRASQDDDSALPSKEKPRVQSMHFLGKDGNSTFPSKEKPRVQSMHLLGKDVPAAEPVAESHKRSKSLTLTTVFSQARAGETSRLPQKRSVDELEINDEEFSRPLMLHRASAASIEVIPKGLVRRVDSGRKSSHDPNLVSPIDYDGSPADALRTLTSTGSVRSISSAGTERMQTPIPGELSIRDGVTSYSSQPVQPSTYAKAVARSRAGTLDITATSSPAIPRKPVKRQSRELDDLISSTDAEPSSTSDIDDAPISLPSTFSPFETKDHKSSSFPNKSQQSGETLEAKIKDILINLPTRIRLTSDSNSSGSPAQPSSNDSTRSSTPAPSLTLSPARQDRSSRRYNAGNSEVKVYHLIRSGQPRDAPPTKLHVRLVGENGERVMVRVGGGWADLAEYLREYSLHHGKRTIQEGRIEVANLPSSGVKASDPAGSSPVGPSLNLAKTRSTSRPDAGFDAGTIPSLKIGKARRSATAPISAESKISRSSSPAFKEPPPVRSPPVQPPPVPVIPSSFREEPLSETTTSPATTKTNSLSLATEVRSRGPSYSTSTFITPSTPPSVHQAQNQNSITTTHPTISATSALSTPVSSRSSPSYTPLGGAGPKGGIRNAKIRAATFGSPALSSPENEAWVQGMIGKARQASAPNDPLHVTTISEPNNTTTTPVSTPAGRRVSTGADAILASTPPGVKRSSILDSTSTPATPDSGRGTQTPSPSPVANHANKNGSADKLRSRSVTGIRRVFLRSSKKSEKTG